MDFDFVPVDSLEKVPQQFRPLYATEAGTDGKFGIAETFKGTAEAFVGLGRALKAERAAAKNRTTVDLSPLAEYGDSPEKIRESIATKIRTLEEELAKGGKINVEKIKGELAAAHLAEKAQLTARATALQGRLYEKLVDDDVRAALARPESKGSPDLLLDPIRKKVKVAEEDGRFLVYVIDDGGDRRYSGVTGQPMTIAELVTEMRADPRYARAFDSDAASGGGMQPGSGKGTLRVVNQGAPKSSVDKIAAGISKGKLRRIA
jgi:hypothetical protein